MTMILAVLLFAEMLNSGPERVGTKVLQRYSANGVDNWSSLILYDDYTFKYESRGGSCWVWQDWQGSWAKEGDSLYLRYSITISESQERIAKMTSEGDSNRISVVVMTPQGTPISDALVIFDDQTQESPTGTDGRAFIDYDKITLAGGSRAGKSRKLEQLTVKDGRHTVTFKIDRPLSNYFEVVLDPDPRTHQEAREDVYRVKANKVVLVKDGIPERVKAFGEARPRVLKVAEEGTK